MNILRSSKILAVASAFFLFLLVSGSAGAQDIGVTPTTAPQVPASLIALPESGLSYGVYDPMGTLTSPDILIEQRFIPWNVPPAETITVLNGILAKGRLPLIALEPYSWGGYNGLSDSTLLSDIATGYYDDVILAQCQALSAFGDQPVIVRFGHEPELYNSETKTGQFPWSTDQPNLFIAAYRYFVTACRTVGADNVKFMWSPAGSGNAPAYYPGDDVVDYIGLTVLGYADWDIQFSAAQTWRSFNELFWGRYALVMDFNKPVIIAELGVCCGSEHQFIWLRDAYYAMNSQQWYPLLKAVVYFNDVNPETVWAAGLTPDWRVCSSLFPASSLLLASTEGRNPQADCPVEFTPLAVTETE